MTQSQSGIAQKLDSTAKFAGGTVVLDEAGLAALLSAIEKQGYAPIGPHVRDGGIVYEPISGVSDLPAGVTDEQAPGQYRLKPDEKSGHFGYNCGPSSWKRYLFPPTHKMWSAKRDGDGFKVEKSVPDAPTYAFIGVRPCELMAMKIQDKVFGYGREDNHQKGIFSDPGYVARRAKALIVVVNCAHSGKNCFCVSMGGDPRAAKDLGYDLALTELSRGGQNAYVVEVGSERGQKILQLVTTREAAAADLKEADQQANKARGEQTKKMIPDVKTVLQKNLRSEHWDKIGERCMSCANCTMVCPTCFCTTIEEGTDLKGETTDRTRSWDSCFSVDFSFIHGGSIRRETKARYRQWITHKLANWHDQYGTSGCVGCGRCITWCPVGIDITEEAKAIRDDSKTLQEEPEE